MVKITLKFDQKKVTEAEEDFKKLDITPGQRVIIEQIAGMMVKFIPLSVMAIKGNTWYTIKEWQTKNHRFIEEIEKMNPQDRLRTAKELFVLGKERTFKMLANPEDQKKVLDEIYEKAWNVYEQYVENAKK